MTTDIIMGDAGVTLTVCVDSAGAELVIHQERGNGVIYLSSAAVERLRRVLSPPNLPEETES